MKLHEFLGRLHGRLTPRTYLEIGVSDGRSLALSRARTVGVDPAPKVASEIHCDLQLVKATSDELFAREGSLDHLDGVVDLALIDGMHLFEYALRDFINVERYSRWSTVIVLDDQLPRGVEEAARQRQTRAWAGDVYKMIPVLQQHRPDLRVVLIDTEPTGVACVFGADPGSTILRERYDRILADFLVADPQQVPGEILSRSPAVRPETLLEAPFWERLVEARDSGSAEYGREPLVGDVDAAAGGLAPELAAWVPDGRTRRVQEATPAAAAAAATRKPRDAFDALARRLPALRTVPGARAMVRLLRRATPK